MPLAIDFGDVARLRGYTVLEGDSGGTLLLLYWEALRQTEADYSILTHVVPASSNPFAQPLIASLDHGLAGSIVSTTTWQPGELVRDPVVLPQYSGAVRILVGLYPTHQPDDLLQPTSVNGISEAGRLLINRVITLRVD